MRRPLLVAVVLSVASLLAACQVSGPGKGPLAAPGANAVTGDPIEVTSLDPVPGEDADPKDIGAAGAAGADTAAPQAAPGSQPVKVADDPEIAEPAAATAEETATPAPKPDLDAIPVTPKSERQLACEKKKGRWVKIGKGEARACVFQTKDAGKRCERESQCDSVCLARSGTCAPFKPMYGCNEILQDNGARVTMCLD